MISPELLATLRRGGARYGVELVDRGARGLVGIMAGGGQTKPISPRLSEVSERLVAMDRHGVDLQLLSSWADLTGYRMPGELGEAFSRLQNETISELVQTHPDRFAGSATVPLQEPDRAVGVLSDAIEQQGLRAVQVGTSVADWWLDDPRFERFWDAAEALGVLVLVHPYDEDPPPVFKDFYLANLIGNPLQTSLALARMMFGGVLERHPRLRVSFAHGGGLLPFQLGRLRKGFASRPETRTAGLATDPGELLQRCYFDTVLNDSRSIAFLAELVGADRLLLGSDFPFDSGDDEPVARVREALSEEQRPGALGATAAGLLGL